MGEEPGQLNLDTIFTQSQKYEQRMHNLRKPTQDVTISAVTSNVAETFDTIVSISKLRYYCPKVMYRYHISIQILYLKSISIGIEISDIKVSVSVSVSLFNILSIKLCISTIFTP